MKLEEERYQENFISYVETYYDLRGVPSRAGPTNLFFIGLRLL